jgi:hypothetical protein
MLLSMIVLAVIVLVLLGIRGGFSVSPGKASVDSGAVPTVDASKSLRSAAGQLRFPVRLPNVPNSWRANSSDVLPIGDASAVRVGWITDGDGYLRLVQSNAPTAALVRQAAEAQAAPRPDGKQTVDGVTWTEYPAVRNEHSWVAELSGVQVLITGNAPTDQFKTLAHDVLAAPSVHR